MEQKSVEGMGSSRRRRRVERISRRFFFFFFFHWGSTIDPLNFSLLLAPPTSTAISHLSFSLSLFFYSTLVFLSLCLGLSAVSRFRRDYELCSTQFFYLPSLFPSFLCHVTYGIFIRRVIFRLWTECFRCYRRRESRWLIDSFALSFKRFCKLIFSHSMLTCIRYSALIVVDIFLFDGTRKG